MLCLGGKCVFLTNRWCLFFLAEKALRRICNSSGVTLSSCAARLRDPLQRGKCWRVWPPLDLIDRLPAFENALVFLRFSGKG